MRLEGRVAVVTGGSRGLGPAISAELAREGALVHVGYRRREREALATVESIRAEGGRAEPLALDVRDPASVEAALRGVIDAHGRVDVLVCSAGVHHDGWMATMPLDAWDEVLRTNLGGTMLCARAVLRAMIAQGRGSIVAVASIAGIRASPGQANYAASKGASSPSCARWRPRSPSTACASTPSSPASSPRAWPRACPSRRPTRSSRRSRWAARAIRASSRAWSRSSPRTTRAT
ncbi:MAG: SDR family oxidoreductase [Sandaracinaceae bacterium]|nr:SDR family oxidoreductase [Sandaracinaceae bacterium]